MANGNNQDTYVAKVDITQAEQELRRLIGIVSNLETRFGQAFSKAVLPDNFKNLTNLNQIGKGAVPFKDIARQQAKQIGNQRKFEAALDKTISTLDKSVKGFDDFLAGVREASTALKTLNSLSVQQNNRIREQNFNLNREQNIAFGRLQNQQLAGQRAGAVERLATAGPVSRLSNSFDRDQTALEIRAQRIRVARAEEASKLVGLTNQEREAREKQLIAERSLLRQLVAQKEQFREQLTLAKQTARQTKTAQQNLNIERQRAKVIRELTGSSQAHTQSLIKQVTLRSKLRALQKGTTVDQELAASEKLLIRLNQRLEAQKRSAQLAKQELATAKRQADLQTKANKARIADIQKIAKTNNDIRVAQQTADINKLKNAKLAKIEALAETRARRKGTTVAQELLNLENLRVKVIKNAAIAIDKQRLAQKMVAQAARETASAERLAANAAKQLSDEQRAQIIRQQKINTLLGDNGAALGLIQGQLRINSGLYNALFRTISFGRQFILDLDEAFTQLQAITASTDGEMKQLRGTLIEVSERTKFTAVEVAQAATVLGQAGFSPREISQAIEPITLFATAVGTDLNKAVDIVTSTLSVFNLEAEQTSRIANVMTGAINNSKLSVDKLTFGIQFAGNVSAQAGLRFEELTAIIGAMANAGIRSGSTLGTGLRQVIIALSAPTEKLKNELHNVGLTLNDVDVRSRGIIPVLKSLKSAGFGASQAFRAFETRAGAAFLAISSQLGTIDEFERKLLLTSAAEQAAEVQAKSVTNTLSRLASVFGSTVVQATSGLVEVFRFLVNALIKVLQFLNKLGPILTGIGTIIGTIIALGITSHLITLVLNMKKLVVQTALVSGAFSGLSTAMNALIGKMIVFSAFHPVTALLSAIALAAGVTTLAFYSMGDGLDEIQTQFANATDRANEYSERIESIEEATSKLQERSGELNKDQAALRTEVIRATTEFGKYGLQVDNNVSSVDQLVGSLQKLRSEMISLNQLNLTSAQIKIDSLILAQKAALSDVNLVRNISKVGDPSKGAGAAQVEIYRELQALGRQFRAFGRVAPSLSREEFEAQSGPLINQANALQGRLRQIQTEFADDKFTQRVVDRASQNIDEALSLVNNVTISLMDKQQLNSAEALNQFEQQQAGKLDAQKNAFINRFNSIKDQIDEVAGDPQKVIDLATGGQFNFLIEQMDSAIESLKSDPVGARSKRLTDLVALREQFADKSREFITEAVAALGDRYKFEIEDIENKLKGFTNKSVVTDADIATVNAIINEGVNNIYALRARQIENEYSTKPANDANNLNKARELANLEAERNELRAKFYDDFIKSLTKTQDTQEKTLVNAKAFGEKMEDIKRGFENLDRELAAPVEAINRIIKTGEGYLDNTAKAYLELTRRRKNEQLVAQRIVNAQDQLAQLNTTRSGINQNIALREGDVAELRALGTDASLDEIEKVQGKINALKAEGLKVDSEILRVASVLNDLLVQRTFILGQHETQNLTIGETFAQGLDVFRQKLVDTGSVAQQFGNGLGGIFDGFQSSLGNTIVAVANGTKSIGQAFRDMAKSILDALLDMVAKILAQQILLGILGLFAGSAIGAPQQIATGPGGGNPLALSSPGLVYRNGGPIRAAQGKGITTRDSQLILAQPGEFVLRKQAVDAVGMDNLRQINAMGSSRISKAEMPKMQKPVLQQSVTKVYVVQEDQPPMLGPNDVLVTVQRDLAQNGQSAQLVKQIVRGGI